MRFVLVDQLLTLERGHGASARFVFPSHLEIFTDHFPGRPLVPGTLLTEAMGQTAGWLLVATFEFRRWPLLAAVDQAKFFKYVEPGDEVVTDAVIRAMHERDVDVQVEARVKDVRVARARLLFHAEELSDGPADRQIQNWSRQTFARLGGDGL